MALKRTEARMPLQSASVRPEGEDEVREDIPEVSIIVVRQSFLKFQILSTCNNDEYALSSIKGRKVVLKIEEVKLVLVLSTNNRSDEVRQPIRVDDDKLI